MYDKTNEDVRWLAVPEFSWDGVRRLNHNGGWGWTPRLKGQG